MYESNYASCVRAATELAQAPLVDDEKDGDRGVDSETRTAARTFLRGEWEHWKNAPDDEGQDAEPDSDDPYQGKA